MLAYADHDEADTDTSACDDSDDCYDEDKNYDDFLDDDKTSFRAEYEEMRDDLLGDSEQLEEEVGFGEIMINQVRMVMMVARVLMERMVVFMIERVKVVCGCQPLAEAIGPGSSIEQKCGKRNASERFPAQWGAMLCKVMLCNVMHCNAIQWGAKQCIGALQGFLIVGIVALRLLTAMNEASERLI